MTREELNIMHEGPKLLSDPVRSRIYLEALLREEITAQHLMGLLDISRSTLGYHLVKLVESGIFQVRIQATGRPTNYYRLTERAKQLQILEKIKRSDNLQLNLEQYAQFLEVLTAHLQAVVSLSREMSESIRAAKQDESRPTQDFQMTSHFIFNFLSNTEAHTWNEKVCKLLVELENEIAQRKEASQTSKEPTYVAFSGVLPILRRTQE
ncbi:MAG: winged helix-turn-helix domain-containing protein [Candidatus Thorarchaeota archaeon]